MASVVIPIDPGLIATNRQWLLANGVSIAPNDVGIVVPDNAQTAQLDPLHVAELIDLKALTRGGVGVGQFGYTPDVLARLMIQGKMPPVYQLDALLAAGAGGPTRAEVIGQIDAAVQFAKSNHWDGPPNYYSFTVLDQTADVWRAYASQWPFEPATQPRPLKTRGVSEIQYGRDARSAHTTSPSDECRAIWGPGYVAADIRMVGAQQMWRCVQGDVPTDPNDAPPPPPAPAPALGPVPDCRQAFGRDWTAVRVSYDGYSEVYECQNVLTGDRQPVPSQTPPIMAPETRPDNSYVGIPADWNDSVPGTDSGAGYGTDPSILYPPPPATLPIPVEPGTVPSPSGYDNSPGTGPSPTPEIFPVPDVSPNVEVSPSSQGGGLALLGAAVLGIFFLRRNR